MTDDILVHEGKTLGEVFDTMNTEQQMIVYLAMAAAKDEEGAEHSINEYDPDSLEHFGVKGMKWGVRKGNKGGGGKPKKLSLRKASAIKRNERDIKDLKKHGYGDEAKALAANNKKMAASMPKDWRKQEPFARQERNRKAKKAAKIIVAALLVREVVAIAYSINKRSPAYASLLKPR